MSVDPHENKLEEDSLTKRQAELADRVFVEFDMLLANPLITSDTALLNEIVEFEHKISDPKYLQAEPAKVKQAFSEIKKKLNLKIETTDNLIKNAQTELDQKVAEQHKENFALKNYAAKISQQLSDIDAQLKQKSNEKQQCVSETLKACRKEYDALEKALAPYRTFKGRLQRGLLRDTNKIEEYNKLKENLRDTSELLSTLKAFQFDLIQKPNAKLPRLSSDNHHLIQLKKSFEAVDAKSHLLQAQKQKLSLPHIDEHRQTIKQNIQKLDVEIKQLQGTIKHLSDPRNEIKASLDILNRTNIASRAKLGMHRH